ncbi:unnamed protein product [Allacma fusca]|uniref:Uncharacterized protein n=1 Tax=Allacma fusca TaxID=39272 RepID=A0A8J2KCD9_9HEXA|nr:unnamed protein product [Allacma fusca]
MSLAISKTQVNFCERLTALYGNATDMPALGCNTLLFLPILFLNFLNIIFLSPFSINYDEKSRSFKIVSSKVDKYTVGIVYLGCAISISWNAIFLVIWTRELYLRWCFGGIMTMWIVYNIFIMSTLWFHQKHIIEFVNAQLDFTRHSITLEDGVVINVNKKIYSLIFVVILVPWMCLSMANMYNIETSFLHFPYLVMDRAHIVIYGLENYSSSVQYAFTLHDYLVAFIYFVLSTLTMAISQSGGLMTLCISVSMLHMVRKFLNQVKTQYQRTSLDIARLLRRFNHLNDVFQLCSSAFDFLYCWIGLILTPMYANSLQRLLSGNVLTALDATIVQLNVLLIMLSAASLHANIKSILPWIQASYSGYDFKFEQPNLNFRVNLLVHQITADCFGLSGKLFVITYGYTGSIFGLVITYALMFTQLQNQKKVQYDENSKRVNKVQPGTPLLKKRRLSHHP